MTTVGKLVVSALSVCILSSPVLLASSTEVPFSTCPSEGSVCNIGVRNGTDVTLRQQCLCSDGRNCPSNFDQKDGAILVEEHWLVTCSPPELLPVCQAGQLSVLAQSNGAEDKVSFQVLCVCPTPYTPGSETKEFGGVGLKVFIYCTGDQNSTENIHDEAIQILNNEVPPISDYYYLPIEDNKRSRGNTAFYKRDATVLSHKRQPAGYSAFYKRDRNYLSSFYKRTPFPKRASFYKRKRSVEDSFDNETPIERSSMSNIGILNEDLPSSFDKKDVGLNSFYKRGLGRDASSFYKRGGYGVSSFYKRTPKGESSLYSLDDGESDDFQAPDEDSEDVTSLDKEAVGDYQSPIYKRFLSSFYKRVPWYNKEGASSFYKKRSLGGRNSAFYTRDDSSEENALDKRAKGQHLSSFYKRSRNNSNISRFYKRYSSNTGGTRGISSFYKRRFGDTSNFYKRGVSDVSNFYKRGVHDDSSFYKRGLSDLSGLHNKDRRQLSRFYKRDIGGVSSFYKRGPGSEFAFYKRGLGDVSNFYKRGSGDLSNFYKRGLGGVSNFYKRGSGDLSNFYKRGLGGVSNFYKRGSGDLSNFYKRGDEQYSFYKRNAGLFRALFTDDVEESEQANKLHKRSVLPNENKKQTGDSIARVFKRAVNDLHSFYKRGPSDESLFSFYKRSPYDNSINNFYKRIPYDHSSSSFYKRTNDINAFYKRARNSNTVSNFYKRFGHDLNAFYKRSPYDLQAFYKRSPGERRSIDDLENFLHQWRENDIAKLYNENFTADHTDSGSIENAVDTDTITYLGDSRQQIKQNLP